MNQYRQYLYWALGLLSVGAIIYFFSDIITWIILAWIVSLLGSPVMSFLGKIRIRKKPMNTALRAAITLLFFVLILGAIVSLFVPTIIQQGNNLSKINYAQAMKGLEEPINHLYKKLEKWGVVEEIPEIVKKDSLTQNTPQIDTLAAQDSSLNIVVPIKTNVSVQTVQIDSLIRAAGDTVARTNIQLQIHIVNEQAKAIAAKDDVHDSTAVLQPHDSPAERLQKQIFTYFNPSRVLRSTFSSIFALLGNLFVLITSVGFIAFFFLQEEGMFSNLVKAPFPDKYGDKIDRTLFLIKKMLIRYFEGILGQMSILTLYLWLLLTLVGAENALLIAFFGAVMNVVPYIGPFLGMAFALVVSICSNLDMDFYVHTMPLLLKVVVVFFSMQAVDNLLLQPLIFSKSVKAHPIEIFVVIVIGSKLGGMIGMVVAIPFYTALRVIASIFLNEFKIVQHLTAQLGIKHQWTQGRSDFVPPPATRYSKPDKFQDGGEWRKRDKR